jgi:hypothetical protein
MTTYRQNRGSNSERRPARLAVRDINRLQPGMDLRLTSCGAFQ